LLADDRYFEAARMAYPLYFYSKKLFGTHPYGLSVIILISVRRPYVFNNLMLVACLFTTPEGIHPRVPHAKNQFPMSKTNA